MVRVYAPRPGVRRAAGFPELEGCPFLLASDMSYCFGQNEFIRARAVGDWTPGDQFKQIGGRVRRISGGKRPRPSSVRAYAEDLANLTKWMEDPDLHPHRLKPTLKTLTEKDLERYRQQMESGGWSDDGLPLADSTINRRLATAIQCLEFLVSRKRRSEIDLTLLTLRHHDRNQVKKPHKSGGQGHTYKILQSRRQNPDNLILPTEQEIILFLKEFDKIGLDPIQKLVAELLFNTGLRISEALDNTKMGTIGLSVTSFPEMATVLWRNPSLDIEVDFDLLGKGNKWRRAAIPGELLADIDTYRNGERKRRLELSKQLPLPAERERAKTALFLNTNGGPLTVSGLRYTWDKARESLATSGANLPGLSPHIARHAYAVYWLQKRTVEDAERIVQNLNDLPLRAQDNFAREHLIALKQRLGHFSSDTTERYLRMRRMLTSLAPLMLGRQRVLDRNDDK